MIRDYSGTMRTQAVVNDSLTDETAELATMALELLDEANDLAKGADSVQSMVIARSASAIVHALLALTTQT